MPIKKCKHCGYRMTKIVYGMPTPEDYEKSNEFLAFAGCVSDWPAKSFECGRCESSLIGEFSPREGTCFLELPRAHQEAISLFIERVARAMNPSNPANISFKCDLQFASYVSDSEMMSFHKEHGDRIVIPHCTCSNVVLRLDSNSLIVHNWGIAVHWSFSEEVHEGAFSALGNLLTSKDSTQLAFVEDLIQRISSSFSSLTCDPEHCDGRITANPHVRWMRMWPERSEKVWHPAPADAGSNSQESGTKPGDF